MTNLAFAPTPDAKKEWARLHRRLTDRLVAFGNLPDSFPWPLQPVVVQMDWGHALVSKTTTGAPMTLETN